MAKVGPQTRFVTQGSQEFACIMWRSRSRYRVLDHKVVCFRWFQSSPHE